MFRSPFVRVVRAMHNIRSIHGSIHAGEKIIQDRGSAASYDAYLEQMDASMVQKVAVAAAFIVGEGKVCDFGTGSGSGAADLAALYPDITVTGVDINEVILERARERYRDVPNLEFVSALPSHQLFHAMFNSSVLHHVTSFSGYDHLEAKHALQTQVDALETGGVVVIRDFVTPDAPDARVLLHLLDQSVEPLLADFVARWRTLHPTPGAPDGATQVRPGLWEMSHRDAVEFVLRKDYADSWDVELKEEYTYATRDTLREWFFDLGLRPLAITAIHNPWIVRNRFQDRIRLTSASQPEVEIDFPATNVVAVAQKVPRHQGIRVAATSSKTSRPEQGGSPSSYVEQVSYTSHRADRAQYDLVRRPNTTVDVVPFFVDQDRDTLHILLSRGFPRPILGVRRNLSGDPPSTYISEPLSVQQGDKPIVQSAEELLEATLGADSVSSIAEFTAGPRFFPSAGGIQEEIRMACVQLDRPIAGHPSKREHGMWSTAGTVMAMDARQLLRAAQVGALFDGRLELAAYSLLLRHGMSVGQWIGDSVEPPEVGDTEVLGAANRVATMTDLSKRVPRRRIFRRSGPNSAAGFLDVVETAFEEMNADDEVVGRGSLEYVQPVSFSSDTITVVLIRRDPETGSVLVAVDDDDLPAAQAFTGHSNIVVLPAWRLPKGMTGQRKSARAWIKTRVADEFGVDVDENGFVDLGGGYYPSPGVTPEFVTPVLVTAGSVSESSRLHWVGLDDVVRHRRLIRCGHLRISVMRAWHALQGSERQRA